jgi:hypothetical protein
VLRIEEAAGIGELQVRGSRVPVEGSLLGRVSTTGEPVRLSQLEDEAEWRSLTGGELDVGPVIVVPLLGSRRIDRHLVPRGRGGPRRGPARGAGQRRPTRPRQ